MIDYHLHSRWSGDSTADITPICRSAFEKGLKEICITEHLDFEPSDISYQSLDYTQCLSQIKKARNILGDKLAIRFGIEVDFQNKFKSQIRDFIDAHELDYIIGSAHYIDGILLENHDLYFPGKSESDAYRPYFDNVLETVETGWFDSLGHLDLCKRYGVRYYGSFKWQAYEEIITSILKAVIKRDMSLEINTSGLRQSPEATYPAKNILELYHNLGGKRIVVGSDAHRAEDVGAGINEAFELAKSVGFEAVDKYHKRKRSKLMIPDII